MLCYEKQCEYRELNGGNTSGDFYYCNFVGVDVGNGSEECILDKFIQEESYCKDN